MQMFKDYMHKKKKKSKIIQGHILLLDIRLWLKVAFHFLKTIFLNIFLIINPYQLCFGK